MATKRDYLPEGMAAFRDWQNGFMLRLQQEAEAWEIPAAAVEKLVLLRDDFISKYAVANLELAHSRTPVQTAAMQESRRLYEADLRSFIRRFIRFNELVVPADKLGLGVTVPDTIRTRRGTPKDIPVVVTVPKPGAVIMVHVAQPPGADGSSRRGKPYNVARIEVAAFTGAEPPLNPDDISRRSQHSRSPVRLSFTHAYTGQMAWIYCRYIGFDNMPGEWSKVSKQVVPV